MLQEQCSLYGTLNANDHFFWLTSQAEDRVKEEDPKMAVKLPSSFYKRKSFLQGSMNTLYKQYVFDSFLLFINTTVLCLRGCVSKDDAKLL